MQAPFRGGRKRSDENSLSSNSSSSQDLLETLYRKKSKWSATAYNTSYISTYPGANANCKAHKPPRRMSDEFIKCIFNWQTNIQLVLLGVAWLGIIVAHVTLKTITKASLQMRLTYLLSPCVFLLLISLMRVVAFDFSLSINSVCRDRVIKLSNSIREYSYTSDLGRISSFERMPRLAAADFSTCDVKLISVATLFFLSTIAFVVLEYFSTGVFSNKIRVLVSASEAALLAISFGAILGITALLLYRGQVKHAFELEEAEAMDMRKHSSIHYKVL